MPKAANLLLHKDELNSFTPVKTPQVKLRQQLKQKQKQSVRSMLRVYQASRKNTLDTPSLSLHLQGTIDSKNTKHNQRPQT